MRDNTYWRNPRDGSLCVATNAREEESLRFKGYEQITKKEYVGMINDPAATKRFIESKSQKSFTFSDEQIRILRAGLLMLNEAQQRERDLINALSAAMGKEVEEVFTGSINEILWKLSGSPG